MLKKLSKTAAVLMAVLLPLTACDDGITSMEDGQLSILLTDAPGDFVSAVVTIEGIYLQGSAEEDAERVWLREDAVTTDLLTLSNDALDLVENADVSAGTYAQLRFVISGGYIEVEGEEEGETRIFASQGYGEVPADRTVDGTLQMPSFAQTGIKVNLPGGGVQVSGTQNILLVDFNVAGSFGQEAGMADMWVMEPVIEAVDFDLSSSVTVTLSLDEEIALPEGVELGDFSAHLEDESGNTKAAVFAESDGTHTASFGYLLPGETWGLTLEVPAGISVETDPALSEDVETLSGTDVQVDVTITSVLEVVPEGT